MCLDTNIKFNSGFNGLQPILPVLVLISLVGLLLSNIGLFSKVIVFSTFIILINASILFEINKYIKFVENVNKKTLLYTSLRMTLFNL